MRMLWDADSATAAEIVDAVTSERDVSMRTVKTLLRRLIAKKAVSYTVDSKDARIYHYRPAIGKSEAVRTKSRNFLEHFYQNNVSELLAHFVSESAMTEDEIAGLRTILEEKTRCKAEE